MSNTTDTVSRTEHDAALIAARSEARIHGERLGRLAAIERIRAITGCAEAKGREPQALMLALDTDIPPDVVAKALAASPTAMAPARPALDARGNTPIPGGAPASPVKH